MQTSVGICNVALARVSGHQLERINSIDDDSTAGTLCRNLLPHVIDVALGQLQWSFAMREAVLAEKRQESTVPDGEYPCRFALPSDCLYPVRLKSGAATMHPAYMIQGRDIVTGFSPAVLVYVARGHDPSGWPPLFADAIAWALAAELATAMVNDVRRHQFCLQNYQTALYQARAAELNSQQVDVPVHPWNSFC